MADLSHQDAVTIYKGCLYIYNDVPHYIDNISQENDGSLSFRAFATNVGNPQSVVIPFKMEEWTSPERIGYFNHGGCAYYAKRFAYRKYRGGLNEDNTIVYQRNGYMGGNIRSVPIASIEVARALLDEYPSLFKAWSYAKDITKQRIGLGFNKCFAFDKQFAIDSLRNIYYKGNKVGVVPPGRVRVENIVFNPGKEYLMAVLIGDYNETARLLKA